MILIHRLTPFLLVLLVALGFASILYSWLPVILTPVITVVLFSLLLGRLLSWDIHSFQFWHFLGTPVLYLLSAFFALLFFEERGLIWALGGVSVFLIFLFSEFVFEFVHLPTKYQPNSLEYVSLILNILTIFFASTVGFGLRLLLNTPLVLLGIIFFALSLFLIYSTLWVSKVEFVRAKPYAIAGSILTTELFLALSYLPSGFYSNAAIITILFYAFLGLTRGQATHKLSKTVLRRYLLISLVLLIMIVATSKWL